MKTHILERKVAPSAHENVKACVLSFVKHEGGFNWSQREGDVYETVALYAQQRGVCLG